ncbi:MAG: hypothetical protein GY763_04790 [Gammaproteobacteria bacterium]|nr:hypothetical protein [Gammaproteobacteria bacterium]
MSKFHPIGRTLAMANRLSKEETNKIKVFCLYCPVNYVNFAGFSTTIFGISGK